MDTGVLCSVFSYLNASIGRSVKGQLGRRFTKGLLYYEYVWQGSRGGVYPVLRARTYPQRRFKVNFIEVVVHYAYPMNRLPFFYNSSYCNSPIPYFYSVYCFRGDARLGSILRAIQGGKGAYESTSRCAWQSHLSKYYYPKAIFKGVGNYLISYESHRYLSLVSRTICPYVFCFYYYNVSAIVGMCL